ncbi:hypothetical protein C9I89_13940 [Photobacterium lipolyticum]|uniref:Transposase IS801/IS1294 domain-containing protein n=1 Tax=Photobacterium lipolyticum TaxID=266810 RepID=A0A2T3MX01_9GAMM|nr:transposase [Photobacterium lipolyticum]PSW04418.1 hypothetical protein C9I89_13940 [Photobacterium lipolyticum]
MTSGSPSILTKSWRTKILTLLRQQYSQLLLPEAMVNQIRDYQEWSRYLDPLYNRYWRVFFAKKTKHGKQTVNYLGRYLKRPPIAASRLKHYDGKDITFVFLNHRTKQYETDTLTQESMILRINDHIPEKHFRMLRYYGFLSNRRRGEQLPLVYKALEMDVEPALTLSFAALMKEFTNIDPYACILCGGRLVFNTYHRGLSTSELIHHQRSLALMRPIRT